MGTPLLIGVVEDNDDLRASLLEVLSSNGNQAIGVPSAEDLNDLLLDRPFDLMLLDLNLPGEDGLSLAARLKSAQPQLRVIMMTTRTSLVDRVRGYQTGADLYLPKPVAEEELLAAVQAMERQILREPRTPHGRDDGLYLDAQSMTLLGPAGEVLLNAREVALLMAMAQAPGYRLEHWQLMEVLGLDFEVQSKSSLAVAITRLRSKLLQAGCPSPGLKALRLTGYQLCVHLEIGRGRTHPESSIRS